MRYIVTIVEQLDRASSELATDHPINNRLALILIDNATELILHRRCTSRLARHSMMSRLWKGHRGLAEEEPCQDQSAFSEDLMTPKQRAKARGKFLDGKLSVLEAMGDLTPTERGFIAIAHGYRNELYHVGLTHDEIIRAIAGHYYSLCCDLFTRMGNQDPFGLTHFSSDTYTEVAQRYLPMRNGSIDLFSVETEVLADKLRRALPSDIPKLPEALAESARSSIEMVMHNFEFLIQDNPAGLDGNEVLKRVQWQQDLVKALERQGVEGARLDPTSQREHLRVAHSLEKTWRQRHTSVPQDKWLLKAEAVRRETNPLVAMHLYQSLRDGMAYLEEAIDLAAGELDSWLQLELDIARGK